MLSLGIKLEFPILLLAFGIIWSAVPIIKFELPKLLFGFAILYELPKLLFEFAIIKLELVIFLFWLTEIFGFPILLLISFPKEISFDLLIFTISPFLELLKLFLFSIFILVLELKLLLLFILLFLLPALLKLLTFSLLANELDLLTLLSLSFSFPISLFSFKILETSSLVKYFVWVTLSASIWDLVTLTSFLNSSSTISFSISFNIFCSCWSLLFSILFSLFSLSGLFASLLSSLMGISPSFKIWVFFISNWLYSFKNSSFISTDKFGIIWSFLDAWFCDCLISVLCLLSKWFTWFTFDILGTLFRFVPKFCEVAKSVVWYPVFDIFVPNFGCSEVVLVWINCDVWYIGCS